MSWIGLRDEYGGVFNPAGLDSPDLIPADINTVVPRGTLMMEFASNPHGAMQTLLDFRSSHPWAAGLTLTLDAHGTLRLTQWQGRQRREFSLTTDVLTVKPSITMTFTWDAPARRGILALEVGDGLPVFADLVAPLPLSLSNVQRMMTDPHHCGVNSGAAFVALADEIMPIGVLPTLGGETMVDTPIGPVAVNQLRAGQMVLTATGEMAQVRWCGSADLPARGRFAPLRMRAPYHGLQDDMVVAANQRIQASGTEVEYLFGTEVVAMRAGHMGEGESVQDAVCGLTYRYWQVLLDRAAPLRAAGLVFEGLDVSGVRSDPALRQHSVLATLPPELMPREFDAVVPLLQDYETLTLRRLLAA